MNKCLYSYQACKTSAVGCRNQAIVRATKDLHCRHYLNMQKCVLYTPKERWLQCLHQLSKKVSKFVSVARNVLAIFT